MHVENVQFIRQSPGVFVARGHMYMTIVCYKWFKQMSQSLGLSTSNQKCSYQKLMGILLAS